MIIILYVLLSSMKIFFLPLIDGFQLRKFFRSGSSKKSYKNYSRTGTRRERRVRRGSAQSKKLELVIFGEYHGRKDEQDGSPAEFIRTAARSLYKRREILLFEELPPMDVDAAVTNGLENLSQRLWQEARFMLANHRGIGADALSVVARDVDADALSVVSHSRSRLEVEIKNPFREYLCWYLGKLDEAAFKVAMKSNAVAAKEKKTPRMQSSSPTQSQELSHQAVADIDNIGDISTESSLVPNGEEIRNNLCLINPEEMGVRAGVQSQREIASEEGPAPHEKENRSWLPLAREIERNYLQYAQQRSYFRNDPVLKMAFEERLADLELLVHPYDSSRSTTTQGDDHSKEGEGDSLAASTTTQGDDHSKERETRAAREDDGDSSASTLTRGGRDNEVATKTLDHTFTYTSYTAPSLAYQFMARERNLLWLRRIERKVARLGKDCPGTVVVIMGDSHVDDFVKKATTKSSRHQHEEQQLFSDDKIRVLHTDRDFSFNRLRAEELRPDVSSLEQLVAVVEAQFETKKENYFKRKHLMHEYADAGVRNEKEALFFKEKAKPPVSAEDVRDYLRVEWRHLRGYGTPWKEREPDDLWSPIAIAMYCRAKPQRVPPEYVGSMASVKLELEAATDLILTPRDVVQLWNKGMKVCPQILQDLAQVLFRTTGEGDRDLKEDMDIKKMLLFELAKNQANAADLRKILDLVLERMLMFSTTPSTSLTLSRWRQKQLLQDLLDYARMRIPLAYVRRVVENDITDRVQLQDELGISLHELSIFADRQIPFEVVLKLVPPIGERVNADEIEAWWKFGCDTRLDVAFVVDECGLTSSNVRNLTAVGLSLGDLRNKSKSEMLKKEAVSESRSSTNVVESARLAVSEDEL
ncbi:unnamed protein product [Amoebophrya sp. A25]|nr:unnamed protein product [Amoebophrya sp. A25]|eukprot:GSA25T00001450001.1